MNARDSSHQSAFGSAKLSAPSLSASKNGVFNLRKLSHLQVQNWESVTNSHIMDLQMQKSNINSTGNVLYNKMKRQYANLKQAHRERTLQRLQRLKDPFM